MKNQIKAPRILKIESVEGMVITCFFNNGELREIDFDALFRKWKVSPGDPEYRLLEPGELAKVVLRNRTLSWPNLLVTLLDMEGQEKCLPYEIGPDVLYENSQPGKVQTNRYHFGEIIRAFRIQKGMTQDELAEISGTSKTYISRLENNRLEPELSTLFKIVEIGLGHKIRIEIV